MNHKGAKHVNYRAGNPAIALTPFQMEVLDGELLGDGCIRTHATPHAHCSARWRFKRRGHPAYLAQIFSSFSPRIAQYSNAWELQLQSNPSWDVQRSRWYPSGKKTVPTDIMLTPTTCYHWYIGDGNLNRPDKGKSTIRVSLAAMGFGREGVEFLAERLRAIGFDFRVSKELCLRTARYARDFLRWICPGRPLDCYAYKWGNQVESSIFDAEDE